MSNITPKKTHALLEKLAKYVMNEVPTRKEMNSRFEQVERRFEGIEKELESKADKNDTQLILNGMDAQAKQIDIIRIEQVATNAAILRHDKRIATLEEKVKLIFLLSDPEKSRANRGNQWTRIKTK